jgi:hypothetical protein
LRPNTEGTNDGSGDIVAEFTQVVKNLQGVAPNAKQLLLVPFDGGQLKNLQTVVATVASINVTLGNTDGFYDGKDGLHPFGTVRGFHHGFCCVRASTIGLCLLYGARFST